MNTFSIVIENDDDNNKICLAFFLLIEDYDTDNDFDEHHNFDHDD